MSLQPAEEADIHFYSPLFTLLHTSVGFVLTYGVGNLCFWGFLHTVFMFWGVVYPFSYRQLKISGRIRYAHIISIILASVYPLPAALIHLQDGYIVTRSPAYACLGRNTDHTFYTFVLPVSIILAAIVCLLVLVFWTILKVNRCVCISIYSAVGSLIRIAHLNGQPPD